MHVHTRIAVLMLIAAMVVPADAADRETIFRGKRDAEINCGPCHAVGQADAAPPLRELWKRKVFAHLRTELAGPLFLRHPAMPDFEPTPEQVSEIVDYIESIQNR
jgi:mono/diheme cytochrome c family protein